MQIGLQPSRTHSTQNRQFVSQLHQICLQIGQAGMISGFSLLLSLNASLVRSQEAQAPASPNAEIVPLESSRITLRVGSQGTQVSELQAILKLLGYYSGAVDGVYQESTAIAVTAFQQAAGLTADGIVGPSTWGRLLPASPAVSRSSSETGAIAPVASSSVPSNTAETTTAETTTAETTTAETTAATLAFPAPSSIEPTIAPSTATANTTETTATTSTPNATASAGGAETEDRSTPSANSSAQATDQSTIDLPILRVGMRGPAVARLQERLRATGFFTGVVDGVFGTETQNAVRAAQRNLVVGPATWGALLR